MAQAAGGASCPLCAGTARYRFDKQEARYWHCGGCGFMFARGATNPNLELPLASFESAYLQYLRPDPADQTNFDVSWRWMIGFGANERSRLLDVGAGSGKFVRFLRSLGVDAEGMEPSAALFQAFLKGDPGFRHGELHSSRPDADGAFDVVTALDVLEHVEEPVPFLRDVAAVLKPGGLLFITTPDVSSVAARLLGRRWHFFNRYHLSYFSPAVLSRAAAEHGLELLESRRRGRLRSIAYVMRYLADFAGGIPTPFAERFADWYLPIDLYDTMHLAFRRSGNSGDGVSAASSRRAGRQV